jgi:hypothetical protein
MPTRRNLAVPAEKRNIFLGNGNSDEVSPLAASPISTISQPTESVLDCPLYFCDKTSSSIFISRPLCEPVDAEEDNYDTFSIEIQFPLIGISRTAHAMSHSNNISFSPISHISRGPWLDTKLVNSLYFADLRARSALLIPATLCSQSRVFFSAPGGFRVI